MTLCVQWSITDFLESEVLAEIKSFTNMLHMTIHVRCYKITIIQQLDTVRQFKFKIYRK